MVQRVLIGKFPDGGIGLRVSEPGYDVMSNPINNERLIFNSDWVALNPIIMRGEITVAANTITTVNYPSSLGYAPFHFVNICTVAVTSMQASQNSWSVGFVNVNTNLAPTSGFYAIAYSNRLWLRNFTAIPRVFRYLIFSTVAFY